jgi:hypothetical protein
MMISRQNDENNAYEHGIDRPEIDGWAWPGISASPKR